MRYADRRKEFEQSQRPRVSRRLLTQLTHLAALDPDSVDLPAREPLRRSAASVHRDYREEH
jgi:hypothetical protein